SAHKQRIMKRKEDQAEEAFQVRHKTKEPLKHGSTSLQDFNTKLKLQNSLQKIEEPRSNLPPCGICKYTNHLEKDCWHKGKPQCKYCKRFEHTEKRYILKSTQKNYNQQNHRPQQAHIADE